ncbi:hypothetical protein EJ377_16005 [Chryseobacterium arthrosphaerae]|uniref:Uncharacterized protein n=1 Tax=Chryseobacterium arthrosphaerae TaxID=651561 RepID=A0A3S0N4Q4_9FLAO|nr:hypothetical protein EJ377_16005 [Chryseobacterium arthrosphaerae]
MKLFSHSSNTENTHPGYDIIHYSSDGATGSDERDMYNSDILLTDPKMMFQKITGFQTYGNWI